MYLLDSNVLIYAHNNASPLYRKARSILSDVLVGNLDACVSFQNLYEFYSIITDLKRVERPLDTHQAREILHSYLNAENLPKIYAKSTNLAGTIELLKSYKVKKQQIFDLILITTMIENEVFGIYTADEKFFKQFDFLEVVNPF